MKMNTYVNFAGTCMEAFRYYEKHLGGKIGMMMTHGQAPDQSRVNPEWKDAVMHARISLGGTELMAADIPNAQPMRSAYLTLGVDSDAEAELVERLESRGWRCDTDALFCLWPRKPTRIVVLLELRQRPRCCDGADSRTRRRVAHQLPGLPRR